MSNKDLKTWISVSVEKELPKEQGIYIIVFTGSAIGAKNIYFDGKKFHTTLSMKGAVWFGKLSLPELMEEQLDWIDKNYTKIDQNSYVSKYGNGHFLNQKRFTYKELTNDFLKQKGIL